VIKAYIGFLQHILMVCPSGVIITCVKAPEGNCGYAL